MNNRPLISMSLAVAVIASACGDTSSAPTGTSGPAAPESPSASVTPSDGLDPTAMAPAVVPPSPPDSAQVTDPPAPGSGDQGSGDQGSGDRDPGGQASGDHTPADLDPPEQGLALGTGSCCQAQEGPGCDNPGLQVCVCELDPSCCTERWTAACALIVQSKYCQTGVRTCVCEEWEQGECCETGWGDFCDVVAEQKCGATAGCF